jgi:hypothetical protein
MRFDVCLIRYSSSASFPLSFVSDQPVTIRRNSTTSGTCCDWRANFNRSDIPVRYDDGRIGTEYALRLTSFYMDKETHNHPASTILTTLYERRREVFWRFLDHSLSSQLLLMTRRR